MNGRRTPRRALEPLALGGMAVMGYVILLGGTPFGELASSLRVMNAVVGLLAIVYYVVRAGEYADSLDRMLMAAVILFACAGLLSQHPRQSFDAVMGALVWTCVLFGARRQLRRRPVQVVLPRVLMALSAVVTLTTAARWLPVLQTWWSVTGIAVPPLDLDYPAQPWGHWHDLSLLGLILYPAWWTGRPGLPRRILAVLLGVIAVAVAVVDGSRNVWIAAVGASVLTAGIHMRRQRPDWLRPTTRVAIAAVVVVIVAVVTGASVLARVTDLAPLGMRGAMWGPLIDLWLQHPVAGLGPGSFPWALQRTEYFDTNSLAPRHPDNAVFQLLPEAGLLGVMAVVLVLVAIAPRIYRGSSAPATWALTVFAIACLGANPSDFGFFVAAAIAWVAYAAPHESSTFTTLSWSITPLRGLIAVSLVVVGVAHASMLAAGIAYDRAREALVAADYERAGAELDVAAALDPGMALYLRQRGILWYIRDEPTMAMRDLQAATRINPADDLAWRALALAARANGAMDAAEKAIETAIGLQRSDPTNLLLSAKWKADDGEDDASAVLLAEVVQAWPAITAAPAWDEILPDTVETPAVIDAATDRWEAGLPVPEPNGGQGTWLALQSQREYLLTRVLNTRSTGDGLNAMTISVFTCDRNALSLLEQASIQERRTYLYWLLKVRATAASGTPDKDAMRVVQIWGGGSLGPDSADVTLNPFHENNTNRFNADIWGYRRLPIDWPSGSTRLPSPSAGAVRWLIDPVGATEAAGLADRLPDCAAG